MSARRTPSVRARCGRASSLRATCDHQGESTGELSVCAGDVIVITRRGVDRCFGFTERRAGAKLIFSFSSYQSINLEYHRNHVSSADNMIDYQQNQIGIHWHYEF